MGSSALVDWAPTLRLVLLAALLALLPLAWVWLRQRGADTRARLAALTTLTLFLTFDLIVFGAFTRLTDSGLGCPDWPGCYGQASPLGARAQIHAAQTAMPSGPVTWSKAWIEMIHRYLAMTVGALILVDDGELAVAWRPQRQRLPLSPWWPTLTLVWVVVQGLFGKYTVTLKLYPAVVTLHLLGGLVLLALLAQQHAAFRVNSGAALALGACFAARRRGRCWPCWACRWRWAAGSAPTTPCWPARAFRNATGLVAGHGLWLPALCCCVSWVCRRRRSLALRSPGGHPHGAPPVCRAGAVLAAGAWPGPCGAAEPHCGPFGRRPGGCCCWRN
jgi:hypothetical protein